MVILKKGTGTVKITAERPVDDRPLCEHCVSVVRYKLSCIAARSELRSTLSATDRLAAASEERTSYIVQQFTSRGVSD